MFIEENASSCKDSAATTFPSNSREPGGVTGDFAIPPDCEEDAS